MKTYIAQIQTVSGTQQIQLAAANIQDAQSQLESKAQTFTDIPARYSIQEQPAALAPNAVSGLLGASGGMFACIVALIIAVHHIERHCKELRRGRK